MAAVKGDRVLPGDVVLIGEGGNGAAVLGPGLREEGGVVYATLAGVLKKSDKPVKYWVDSRQKRYYPSKGDRVIGVVTNKLGDDYKLDIAGPEQASLSYLSFEGATKQNRPDIKVGDLVYGQLSSNPQSFEFVLTCVDASGHSSGMGLLHEGHLLRLSVSYARRLLSYQQKVLKALGNIVPHEAVVGENGRIWVKGRTTAETLVLARAIAAAEGAQAESIKDVIRKALE